MRILIASISVLVYAIATPVIAKSAAIRYVGVHQIAPHAVIVDTRAQALCQQRSVAGAHCLPASDLLGPAGELPSFADIFWALGTAGLDGSETVLVTGDRAGARDFIAGILYLCGQAHIEILKPAIDKVLRTGKLQPGPGKPRAILRQRIYQATMRDTAMILPGELTQLRRDHPHIRFLDAGRLQATLLTTADIDNSARHKTGFRSLHVIYGTSVRNAVAWFTRLLARHEITGKRIRVVPVAISDLHAKVDRTVHEAAALAWAFGV